MATTDFKVKGKMFWRYSGDEKKAGDLAVTIDWDKLAETMGVKAAFNAGKKSRALKGAVVVKFLAAK